jgi:hypothetical protein
LVASTGNHRVVEVNKQIEASEMPRSIDAAVREVLQNMPVLQTNKHNGQFSIRHNDIF